MSTDTDWIRWGERDPYFAVITDPKYRTATLTEEARQEFFETGRGHVRHIVDTCRRIAGPAFTPKRALDFGCGVGRVAIPLAEQVAEVVGVDVSPAMLAEAERNAQALGRSNLIWLPSDDALSSVKGRFDLVHSCITLQHIAVQRGRRLFARLIDLVGPGGVGAIQITYGNVLFAGNYGQAPAFAGTSTVASAPEGDPDMQMNSYNLGELAYLLQTACIRQFQAEFTDHGGELGVFLFFGK